MSPAGEFSTWFAGSFLLALIVPVALAIGLYWILRTTFRLAVLWSALIAAAAVALVCALTFAP